MFNDVLKLNDPAWKKLKTGFGNEFNDLELLERLAFDEDFSFVLGSLGQQLNNQGEIGDVEYAILPWIVRAIELRRTWNFLAESVVLDIDICRRTNNPPADFLIDSYASAMDRFLVVSKECFPKDGSPRDYCLLAAIVANSQGNLKVAKRVFDLATGI